MKRWKRLLGIMLCAALCAFLTACSVPVGSDSLTTSEDESLKGTYKEVDDSTKEEILRQKDAYYRATQSSSGYDPYDPDDPYYQNYKALYGSGEVTHVELTIEPGSDITTKKAVVVGYDDYWNPCWTYESAEGVVSDQSDITEIYTTYDSFIFVAFGDVICLDYGTGDELWINHEYQGAMTNWAVDEYEDTLYLCGYHGPDLFALDIYYGDTINRIDLQEYDNACWMEYIDSTEIDVFFEGEEKMVAFDPYTGEVK